MKRYTKTNNTLPKTPFKKGDIIVYENKDNQVENIIVVDSIERKRHGDIHYYTSAYFWSKYKPFDTIEFISTINLDYRNWFIGEHIRKATANEVKLLLQLAVSYIKNHLKLTI